MLQTEWSRKDVKTREPQPGDPVNRLALECAGRTVILALDTRTCARCVAGPSLTRAATAAFAAVLRRELGDETTFATLTPTKEQREAVATHSGDWGTLVLRVMRGKNLLAMDNTGARGWKYGL